MTAAETTRFAPSPSGRLHLGHALAAIVAHDVARQSGGRFLVRIEDIDTSRCRAGFEAAILEDLAWLGLSWEEPVLRQSQRLPRYRQALTQLVERGLGYPCFCTRGEIAAEIARMPSAPQGPAGAVYPGTCRALSGDERAARLASGATHAWRLDVGACRAMLGNARLEFEEAGRGPAGEHGVIEALPQRLGDIVVGRKDLGVSYHLAVVLDDHEQGVTRVTRGEDLFHATHVQRLLQAVLGLRVPRYQHHRLVHDESGRRLAKRDEAQTLAALRAAGVTPAGIRRRLGAAAVPMA